MAQRSFNFLVVCLLMFYGTSFGQKNTQNNPKTELDRGINGVFLVSNTKVGLTKSRIDELVYPISFMGSYGNSKPVQTIPAYHYLQHLGFICKAEWKLEKISSMPFRFRLGSLEQVNWLEGKLGAVKPY